MHGSAGEHGAIEPGLELEDHRLVRPVVTCAQAAAAKGIPLEDELKTLLLITCRGLVALHLPGDGAASLRRVKDVLDVRQACLAAPDDLRARGLLPGTVSAVRNPVWSLPHLVSARLLRRKLVSTNNGTRFGYHVFRPDILLSADSVLIGEFEAMEKS